MPPYPRHYDLCWKNPDGSLTLGFNHILQIGFNLGRFCEALKEASAALDVNAEGLAHSSRDKFLDILADPPEREEDLPSLVRQKMENVKIEAVPDPAYRADLKSRLEILAKALEPARDAIRDDPPAAMVSPVPFISRMIRNIFSRRPQDDVGAKLSSQERALGQELLEDATADRRQRAQKIRDNGITLPKPQANALLSCGDIIREFFAEAIYDSIRAGNDAKAREYYNLACNVGSLATYVKQSLTSEPPSR